METGKTILYQLFLQGKSTDYHAIIEHLSAAQMKTVVMRRWLQGLSLCVSKFTKGHEKLVGATLVSVCVC